MNLIISIIFFIFSVVESFKAWDKYKKTNKSTDKQYVIGILLITLGMFMLILGPILKSAFVLSSMSLIVVLVSIIFLLIGALQINSSGVWKSKKEKRNPHQGISIITVIAIVSLLFMMAIILYIAFPSLRFF